MNIGIDVDGVLTYYEEFQLKYGMKYFKNIPEDKIDKTKPDLRDMFGVSKKDYNKFWAKYIWKYCITEPMRKDASAVINKLSEEGNKIYIITSRAHVTETGFMGKIFRKMLFDWLKKNNINYEAIELCREKGSEIDKVEACKKYNIDVMIDDQVENIIETSKVCKEVLCFHSDYNKDVNGNNIKRVYNWNDVYDEIHKMNDKDYFTVKSNSEISQMSREDKIKYYTDLKEYIHNLPFDDKKYDTEEKFFSKIAKVGVPIFNLCFNPKIFGKENIPNEKGYLLVSNHNNYYDQFPIISALGWDYPVHFLTATKMLKLKRGGLYLKTGVVSVNREDEVDRKNSSLEIKKILSHRRSAGIFPEGRTNREHVFLMDFHPGAVAIARDVGCPLLPISVNDNYSKKNGDLCVRFGEPIYIEPDADVIEETAKLKNIIGDLKQQNIDYCEEQKSLKRTRKN